MHTEISQVDGISIVRIQEKRIDAARASDFRAMFQELIQAGHRRIALDLSKVEFMDSSGLGALVGGLKLMGDKGDLALFGVTGLVESLFRLTRMDKIFPILGNEADTLDRLRT
ncbi:MAG: STAS domain-containing protein [Halothiobacillaceae bacterium]|nr:MAG: STAS domain-containing protein [Halothiobacillaceae bacterium]